MSDVWEGEGGFTPTEIEELLIEDAIIDRNHVRLTRFPDGTLVRVEIWPTFYSDGYIGIGDPEVIKKFYRDQGVNI